MKNKLLKTKSYVKKWDNFKYLEVAEYECLKPIRSIFKKKTKIVLWKIIIIIILKFDKKNVYNKQMYFNMENFIRNLVLNY